MMGHSLWSSQLDFAIQEAGFLGGLRLVLARRGSAGRARREDAGQRQKANQQSRKMRHG